MHLTVFNKILCLDNEIWISHSFMSGKLFKSYSIFFNYLKYLKKTILSMWAEQKQGLGKIYPMTLVCWLLI